MARPPKNNCDYFPHDANMRNHRKVKAIRNKFANGYAIWVMLLEYLTDADGNEFQDDEIEYELMSGDFGFSVTEIRGVVEYCISLEMLFRQNGFVYSESLNDRLAPVYVKRGKAKEASKKQQRVNGKYASSNTVSTGVSVTEMPQSKVKKSKEDKKKKEKAAPAKADAFSQPFQTSFIKDQKNNGSPKKAAAENEEKDKGWELWVDAYFKFREVMTKTKENPEGEIIKLQPHDYAGLKKIRRDLTGAFGDVESDALQEFVYILQSWANLPDYHRYRIQTVEIHKDLPNIRLRLREAPAKGCTVPYVTDAIDLYITQFHKLKGYPPNINGKAEEHVSNTLKYLKDFKQGNTWEKALNAFERIVKAWPQMEAQDPFYANNFTLSHINSNTANIIGFIKSKQIEGPNAPAKKFSIREQIKQQEERR